MTILYIASASPLVAKFYPSVLVHGEVFLPLPVHREMLRDGGDGGARSEGSHRCGLKTDNTRITKFAVMRREADIVPVPTILRVGRAKAISSGSDR
jgi:hypothetical protein